MSAVIETTKYQPSTPELPLDIREFPSTHGVVKYHLEPYAVHGVHVHIKTEVTGSGSGYSHQGTGSSSMSITSESTTVREFWLKPTDGSKELFFELENSEFVVADGQTVVCIYSQVGDDARNFFGMVNLSGKTGYTISDLAKDRIFDRCCKILLKRGSGSAWIVNLSVLAWMGIASYVWYKMGWKFGLPTAVAGLFVFNWLFTHVPFLKRAYSNSQEKTRLHRDIEQSFERCIKFINETISPRWVLR